MHRTKFGPKAAFSRDRELAESQFNTGPMNST